MKLLGILFFSILASASFAETKRTVTIEVEEALRFSSTQAFSDGHINFYNPTAYGYNLAGFWGDSTAAAYCQRMELSFVSYSINTVDYQKLARLSGKTFDLESDFRAIQVITCLKN
jgi:hypothetical protein